MKTIQITSQLHYVVHKLKNVDLYENVSNLINDLPLSPIETYAVNKIFNQPITARLNSFIKAYDKWH
ncbi:hypothetical protein C8Z91_08490 [Paenibacillus elgii]|uniref:Uncharacterized protein n=1 Tax=Paenibacillus elgii TaxID=189691 RepID=A0A2T6G5L6_9BACL|nr:hypothetical protein C8Z91_08490 [Paenibacillus elgii]